jgi:hypothetical protein
VAPTGVPPTGVGVADPPGILQAEMIRKMINASAVLGRIFLLLGKISLIHAVYQFGGLYLHSIKIGDELRGKTCVHILRMCGRKRYT